MSAYKMLSDDFIGKHRQFMAANSKTMFSTNNRGAHDAVTPGLRNALKQAGIHPKQLGGALNRVQRAYDEMTEEGAGPDPDQVRRILACVREALGDVAKSKVAKVIQNRWPESMLEPDDDMNMGEENEEDMGEDMVDPDEPDSANSNRNQNYRGQGGNAFGTDDPPEFGGMPKPGGKMVPMNKRNDMASDEAMYFRMFPDASRIGLDNQVPATPRSYAVTPQVVRPAHAKANRKSMAMDSAERAAANSAENDYERWFGPGSSRVVEV